MNHEANIIEITAVIRDVVDFIESLKNVKLEANVEALRENLLIRLKTTLTTCGTIRTSSPEPYLNMNASSKGLLLTKDDLELQEYVPPETSPNEHRQHDYYESFNTDAGDQQTFESDKSQISKKEECDQNKSIDEAVEYAYNNMSASEAKNLCHKCGPLYRKEGKKLRFFGPPRKCWLSLVGHHFLIYGTEQDSRPHSVMSIRGYMARPTPNVVTRDQRRNESSFEVFCPGNKTMQFTARTLKDMEQWVAKICEIGNGSSTDKTIDKESNFDETATDDTLNIKNDRYQERYKDINIGISQDMLLSSKKQLKNTESKIERKPVNDTDTSSNINNDTKTNSKRQIPPPLPARIPLGRLPSIPNAAAMFTDEHAQNEVENIYHLIDDLRDSSRYQNLADARKSRTTEVEEVIETYDDAQTLQKKSKNNAKVEIVVDELYDDITSVITQPATAKSTPEKKSFLNRVMSRREESRKIEKVKEKKTKEKPFIEVERKTPEELPSYDDVTDWKTKSFENEQCEYNSVPPPRPIYINPPIIVDDEIESEEIYDDIQNYQQSKSVTECIEVYKPELTIENIHENDEHYQIPRSELCRSILVSQEQEELYDDVDLMVAARQKYVSKANNDSSKILASPEKKPWNRFVNPRKFKSVEPADSSKQLNNDDQTDSINENQGLTKMNTLQKIINKMENSLGKSSVKTVSS